MAFSIDYTGNVVIVTGVTAGIGLGVAECYAQAGANVVGCARRGEDSPEAITFKEKVEAHGVESLYVQCNVTSMEDLQKLVDKTIAKFGRIDVLVSSAGANVFDGATDCTEQRWQHNLDLNLSSHWRVSKLCKPYLEQSDLGCILLMTSNHAYASIKGCFPYNVAKTAITGLVRSLTLDWSPKVRIVGIAPGFISTEGGDTWFNSFPDPEVERERTNNLHPMKRIATVEEVGQLCVYLSSSAARFISGTTILMDGGRSAVMQDQ